MEEKAAPQVVRIADLVQYQDDSIISRTVLKKEGGSVTLFAFDRSQALSEHSAPFDALVQVLEGEAEITISGSAYRLVQGEMIVMPANQPHAVKAPARFKMSLTMVKA